MKFASKKILDDITKPVNSDLEIDINNDTDINYSKYTPLDDYSYGGYSGYSMSNRAVEAYEVGRKPISSFDSNDLNDFNKKVLELGATSKIKSLRAFKDILYRYGDSGEWHHTSSMYNETRFYDPSLALDKLSEVENINEIIDEANKPAPKEPTYKWQGDFTYLEWGGTKTHPKATERTINNAIVEEKGKWYTIYDENGNLLFRKGIDTNGVELNNKQPLDAFTQEYVDEINNEKQARLEKSRKAILEQKNKTIELSDNGFKEFSNEYLNNNYEISNSGNIYPKGKKPSTYDYEHLDKFFEVGDRMYKYNEDGSYTTQIWNGENFDVLQDNSSDIQYSKGQNLESIQDTNKLNEIDNNSGIASLPKQQLDNLQDKLLYQFSNKEDYTRQGTQVLENIKDDRRRKLFDELVYKIKKPLFGLNI